MDKLLLEKISHQDLKNYIQEFYLFAKNQLNIDRKPKIFLRGDSVNANDFLGKTGYYDPDKEEIHLFITDRHAKDVIRSLAHELIHHAQKLTGMDKNVDLSITASDPSYSLHNKELRQMERDAFERGNMMFRDWTDTKKLERKKIMAEMKKSEVKSAHKAAKKMMPSMKKQYGKKGEEIAYATATKMKKSGKLEEMEEGAKPDFLDLDKDGNKKEPMKTAAKQAKNPVKKEGKMKIKVKGKKMEQEGVTDLSEVSDDEEDLDVVMSKPKYKAGMSDFEYGEKERGKRGSVDTGDEASIEDIEDLEIDDDEGEVEVQPKRGVRAKADPYDSAGSFDRSWKERERTLRAQSRAAIEDEPVMSDEELQALIAKRQQEKEELQREIDSYIAQLEKEDEGSLELQENHKNPYPVLFEQRQRLLNEAFKTKEERVYNELVRRFIKK